MDITALPLWYAEQLTWVTCDDEPVVLRLGILVWNRDALLVHVHVWELDTVPEQQHM
jgi:hypothetical protein